MKLTYETHYRSDRPDGRFTSSLAAHMEMLRHYEPLLSLKETVDTGNFDRWRTDVRAKMRELLLLPEVTEQPAPVRISRVQRDGYAVEKWELYPDDYTVVPFLLLIPDGVDAEHKAPAVMCLPGSIFSKEFLAGEPLLDREACRFEKMPDRNRMALCMVKNGMVAAAFDHPEIAECALETGRPGEYGQTARVQMCYGYIQSGYCYPGVSTFQKMRCLDFLKTLDYVDQERIAVSAHSLGTVPALALGLLCDEIKAVVFNDFLCDSRVRFASVTEEESTRMEHNDGNWHEIPGLWKWFGHQDLLAALAPKYLALNEGGPDELMEVVRRGYALAGASDRLQISYYPKYADPASRIYGGKFPRFGISMDEYFAHAYVEPTDHSFRKEPAVRLLKKCFDMKI